MCLVLVADRNIIVKGPVIKYVVRFGLVMISKWTVNIMATGILIRLATVVCIAFKECTEGK